MQEITQTGESYAAPNESEPAPQVSTSGNSIAAWRGVGFALGSLILAFAAQAYFEGQRQYSWGGAFLYAGAVVLFLLAVLGIEGIDIHPPSRDSLAKWRRDIVVELRNLWLWVAVPQEDGLGQAPGPGIGTSPGELPQDHIGVGPDGDGESGPFEDKEGAPDQDARVHSHSTPSAGRWLRWRTAFEGLGFGRSAILPADQARSDDVGAKTAWRTCLVEWAAIFLVVLAFCSRFLDLGSRHVLNGNESEIVQALDWLLFKSITMHGQFPLWNPYLRAGQPFAADPFLHAYNPLATLPVIIFGVADGVKIALFLSFLFAGLGMWWLCKVSSVGTVVRVWAALSYAFTGQAVARFFQGEYDFVLGFAWIPWALAGLMAATETRRPRHIAVAVISMALLFFSGNVYYSFYMLLVVALFVPIALVRVKRQDPFLIFDRGKTWILLIIALLSVGLVAIQLLPLGEFWPRMAKQIDVEAKGAHSLGQILLDYLSTDARRADAVTTLPPEEFYSYTGLGPFVGFLLLPLAVWKRDKRLLLFLGLLLALVVAWVDIRDMPWRELYSRNGILNQFRYPTRILIYGACAIILLAALGLDSLWKLMRVGVERRAGAVQSAVRGSLPRVGPVVLCAFMVWSVADIYTHNRQVIGTHERYEISHDLVGWLAQHDNSLYYVGTPNNWHGPFFQNEVRNIDSWYGFEFVRYDPNMPGQRPVRARPNYVILGNDRAPVETDAVAVRRTATHTIYRLPSSLPYAFAIQNEKLSGAPQDREVQSNEVTAVTAVASGPNSVEIVSQGNSGSTLVVLSNMYPGWQVQVDGREQPLRNVGGYVAADLQPGLHKYVFTFSSTPFNLGLVISLLALIATLGLLVPDLLVGLRKTTQRLRTLSPSFGSISPRTAESWRGGSGGIRSSWLPVFNLLASSRKIDVLDKLGIILFILALGVYGLTRLLALDQFPIYFFSDEAVQTNLGLELVRRGFHDARGVFLPPFFPNGPYWNLSLTVYLQGIMASLFGSSIVVTRATSAILEPIQRGGGRANLQAGLQDALLVAVGLNPGYLSGVVLALADGLRDRHHGFVLQLVCAVLSALPLSLGALPLSGHRCRGRGVLLVCQRPGDHGHHGFAPVDFRLPVSFPEPEDGGQGAVAGSGPGGALSALPYGAPRSYGIAAAHSRFIPASQHPAPGQGVEVHCYLRLRVVPQLLVLSQRSRSHPAPVAGFRESAARHVAVLVAGTGFRVPAPQDFGISHAVGSHAGCAVWSRAGGHFDHPRAGVHHTGQHICDIGPGLGSQLGEIQGSARGKHDRWFPGGSLGRFEHAANGAGQWPAVVPKLWIVRDAVGRQAAFRGHSTVPKRVFGCPRVSDADLGQRHRHLSAVLCAQRFAGADAERGRLDFRATAAGRLGHFRDDSRGIPARAGKQ
ncbi:MAG: hypothetical protein M1358_19470 [Chloroflexi bacterium]|nr:hypothetical protein [Chloroflexota bacterium]